MTLTELIDIAIEHGGSEALYSAEQVFLSEHQNARGQHILTVKEEAVLDVLRQVLMFPRALSEDEKILLEGLR